MAKDGSGNSNSTNVRVLDVVDNDAPIIQCNISNTTYTGASLKFNVTVEDNINVNSVYLNFSVGTGARSNVSMEQGSGDLWTYTFNVSRNSTDNIAYHISAVDMTGNWKNTEDMTIAVIDNIPPVARAENLTVIEGNMVILDAANSTDNVGISNYTWQIVSNDTSIRLYGVSPHVNLNPGVYNAILTVSDSAGNTANTTAGITVLRDTDRDGIPDDKDTDDDGDGMPDTWEEEYGLNPLNASDASGDDDGDGLSNVEEFRDGTDPENPDTDGDGIPDGKDPQPLSPGSKISDDHTPYALLAIIALGLLAAGIYVKKRRKNGDDEPDPFEEDGGAEESTEEMDMENKTV